MPIGNALTGNEIGRRLCVPASTRVADPTHHPPRIAGPGAPNLAG